MTKSNVFNRLNELMNHTQEVIAKTPWDNDSFYANWLAQTNYYTSHTTRLLALAGALMPLENQPLHNRFLKHAAEEKGHENLSLLDLKNLKHRQEDYPELPSTQSFYQVQYFWIDHRNPLAFFGFILYLESVAARFGKQLTDKIDKAHGIKCANFLKVHAEEDVGHVAEAVANVEKFPEDVQQIILENMGQAAYLYESIMLECAQYAQKKYSAA